MADNYLEKKYDEYLRGKTIIRRANPSLDTLLDRISGPQEKSGAAYSVKQAQLDAVLRSVSKLCPDARMSSDEDTGRIFLHGRSPEELGARSLAARLKAAELGLRSSLVTHGSEGLAEITLYK